MSIQLWYNTVAMYSILFIQNKKNHRYKSFEFGSSAISWILSTSSMQYATYHIVNGGHHLSWSTVTYTLQRSTRGRTWPVLAYTACLCLTLLRIGFTKPTRHRIAGELLPHRFSLTSDLRSLRRFTFCCTFRRVTPPGS